MYSSAREKHIDSGFAIRITIRFKKIGSVGSIRISRGYRALGLFKGDMLHWFWIGPHDEYERIVRNQ